MIRQNDEFAFCSPFCHSLLPGLLASIVEFSSCCRISWFDWVVFSVLWLFFVSVSFFLLRSSSLICIVAIAVFCRPFDLICLFFVFRWFTFTGCVCFDHFSIAAVFSIGLFSVAWIMILLLHAVDDIIISIQLNVLFFLLPLQSLLLILFLNQTFRFWPFFHSRVIVVYRLYYCNYHLNYQIHIL